MKNAVENKIFKDFGVDNDNYLNDIVLAKNNALFKISPKIDHSCGGGIREGSLILISGKEKLGKSTLSLRIAAAAQNYDSIKRKVYYYDVENRIQKRNISVAGLDTSEDRFKLIGSCGGNLLTAESVFLMVEQLCRATRNAVFIIDSFGVMISKSEMEYDYEKANRSNVPVMTSIFTKKMAQLLRPNQNTMIGILQSYANTNAQGLYAPQTKEGGGTKLRYQSDYKFALTHTEDINKNDTTIGHKVNFRCAYHPDNSPAFDSYFIHTFGTGVDVLKEVADMAAEIGVVKKAGAWIKFTDMEGKEKAIQGAENFAEYVKENKDFYDHLIEEINQVTS